MYQVIVVDNVRWLQRQGPPDADEDFHELQPERTDDPFTGVLDTSRTLIPGSGRRIPDRDRRRT